MRRYSHFIRHETVFADYKESGLPMKIQDYTINDFIEKEQILCKETCLSRTENTGSDCMYIVHNRTNITIHTIK